MCLSHQKQSPQGRLSICNALLSDRAYKKQDPYAYRRPLMDQRSYDSAGLCVLVLAMVVLPGKLDIAKSVFQVHGVDPAGEVIIRRTALCLSVLPEAGTVSGRH